MSLSKNLENLVIGFDLKKCKVSILHTLGNDVTSFEISEFEYNSEFVNENKIVDLLSNAVGSYLKGKTMELPDVYIVLPDELVNIEYIRIPFMQSNRMNESLKTELLKLYTNYYDYEINSTIISKNKKTVLYANTMVAKNVLYACQNTMKKFNLNLRNISYKSNAICNSFLSSGSRVKHSNFAFANICSDCTSFMYVRNEKLIDFINIPLGTDYLNGSQSESESIDHTSAEFLKYNLSNGVDGTLIDFGFKNEFMKKFIESKNELLKESEKKQQEVDEFLNTKDSGAQKRFKSLLKYVDLINDRIQKYDFPIIENLVVNFCDSTKIDLENLVTDYNIVDFGSETDFNSEIKYNLELNGMLYAVAYNKGQNFVDKEKQSLLGKITMYFSILFRSVQNFLSKTFKKDKNNANKK